ncbi:hypothetical protein Pres01_26680 [Metapseudomonas resinovorans]|nr:hypothetical protein Pres01_26680 [Pseudomonas resinovorans]
MLEGELENVLGGLAGVGRRQFGDVEGVAHQAGFLLGVALGALYGAHINKGGVMPLNNQQEVPL